MKLKAEIDNKVTKVEIEKENIKTPRILSTKDFLHILSCDIFLETGILPRNTRYYAKRQNNILIILEFDPKRVNINHKFTDEQGKYYNKQLSFNVPTPRLLLTLQIKEDKGKAEVIKSYIHCVLKNAEISFETDLYIFPFPNEDQNDGICWGDTVLPTFTAGKYQNLDLIMDIFYNSQFNDDLSGGYNEIEVEREGVYYDLTYTSGFFHFLEDENEFPEKLLLKKGVELGEWIEEKI